MTDCRGERKEGWKKDFKVMEIDHILKKLRQKGGEKLPETERESKEGFF